MSFPKAHWPEWNFRVSPLRFFFVPFSEDWARLIWPCLSPVTEADAQTVRQSLQNDVQVHDARPEAAMRGASLQAHPDDTVTKEMLQGSREETLVVPMSGENIRSAVRSGDFAKILHYC